MPYICINCEKVLYDNDSGRKLRVVTKELIDIVLDLYNEEVFRQCKESKEKIKNVRNISELLNFKIIIDNDHDMSEKHRKIMYTIIFESIMINYDFDEDIKKILALDLIDSTERQLMPYDKIKILCEHLNGNKEFAELIEQNEIMNASNLMSWAQSKSEGSKYYVIDFCSDPNCKINYEGKIFNIDEIKYLPPIYSTFNCGCVASFFFNDKEAQSFAKQISIKKANERRNFEEPYAQGYIAFNLAEDKFHKYKKQNAKNKQFLEMIPLLKRCFQDKISDFTKARVYRMLGEIYLKNSENQLAIDNFEKALKYNPKIGINRTLNVLKRNCE